MSVIKVIVCQYALSFYIKLKPTNPNKIDLKLDFNLNEERRLNIHYASRFFSVLHRWMKENSIEST